jgi:putative ATP-binding cassette transporter
VTRFASTIGAIWRLSVPYFYSDDRWPGRILLGAVVAIELALVGLNVILNEWYNRFYNTLQDRDWNAFVSAILFFCVLAAVFTVLAVYQTYLNQWLQIRWRRWMTQTYLHQWLDNANHYRMQLLGDAADNPDQRISEDVRMFINSGTDSGILPIGLGLLNSVVTLCSFVVILWHLSQAAPLTLAGWVIPGYLVWAAVIYALVGTALTHWIGWKLIPLSFQQQHFEADFRFNLVRTRENAEQIAASSGEAAEHERHLNRFSRVVENWMALMQRQKRLLFLTQSYTQAAVIFPYIMVSPAFFSGAMQLGGMMQTASAFGQVQNALSYFVTTYRNLAEFRAVVDRLTGFEAAIALGRAAAVAPPAIQLEPRESTNAVAVDHLDVRLPDGQQIAAARHISFAPGDRILVTGPSGAGKSTLFRAIAGIWPFGSGQVIVPTGAKIMLLPQRPYFPIATLANAIGYPAKAGAFDDASIAEVLTAVGLPQLILRLGEEGHWNHVLSLGEQQRLAIARALLHAPDFLFLDEATASLDEAAEAALYRLLQARLEGSTIISIGHRSTLGAFHGRRIELVADGDIYRVQEATLVSAAE